jgi:selenocysteine lyase/cysteine desulfurase
METGTQSFESIAGVTAAVDYLAGLGAGAGRRERLESGYGRIREHERVLAARFLGGVSGLSRVTVHGVPDADDRRVATFALSVDGIPADEVAARLAEQGVYVWSGHYYALNAIERLGFLEQGGLVRIGFVHYNTSSEVDRALEALASL